MRVFVAGASGAVGQPLIDLLIKDGHEVYGITQSEERGLIIAGKGAKPLILNILDRVAVDTAMKSVKPDVVINMLTHLPKEYTPQAMAEAAELDAKIRSEGGSNLQSAAEALGSTKRYIVQSSAFWYEPGVGLADENTPFVSVEAPTAILEGSKLYNEIERRVLESDKMEGVALRFGFFYGPNTWFHTKGNVAEQIRKKEFCVIGKGTGVWNFVHVEDAAQAIVASLYCYPGAYNIVNNRPVQLREWLPAFARYAGIPQPAWITEDEGLKQQGAVRVFYATKLRGASNAKAKRAFNFQPRTFEWML